MANFFRPADYAAKIHPSLKYAWINIPKNCSSFVQKVLDYNGWINLKDDMIDIVLSTESIEKFVILRDPVQRWMSGFAQTFGIQDGWDPILNIDLNDLDTLLDNDAWWKIVYINPVMCFHTEMQHRYISNAKNVKYIKIQDKHPYNVPENITTFRSDVRAKSNEMESQIDACTTVDELKALYEYTTQEDGTQTRPLAEFPEEI